MMMRKEGELYLSRATRESPGAACADEVIAIRTCLQGRKTVSTQVPSKSIPDTVTGFGDNNRHDVDGRVRRPLGPKRFIDKQMDSELVRTESCLLNAA